MLTIMRMNKDAIIPKRAHKDDAGLDLFSVDNRVLEVGKGTLLGTGWAMSVPSGHVIKIISRSGMALKNGVIVYNSPGIVDSGFSGEVKVLLYNGGTEDVIILKGQKIAQMLISKIELWSPEEVRLVENTDRGENGFGSSGV